jgi:hypothetical protein
MTRKRVDRTGVDAAKVRGYQPRPWPRRGRGRGWLRPPGC